MKRSKFSEQQIAFILRQAEEGTSVEEVCRKAGVSVQTYYRWRKKYGGLMPSEMRRLKVLEAENGEQVIQGDYAGLLAVAEKSPGTKGTGAKLSVVAGARNQRYLQLVESRLQASKTPEN